jgi:hypothetical protein
VLSVKGTTHSFNSALNRKPIPVLTKAINANNQGVSQPPQSVTDTSTTSGTSSLFCPLTQSHWPSG